MKVKNKEGKISERLIAVMCSFRIEKETKVELDEIEDKIRYGEMSAAQVFTQMKQYIVDRNSVIDEAINTINGCELVKKTDESVKWIRLYEAVGALQSLKVFK